MINSKSFNFLNMIQLYGNSELIGNRRTFNINNLEKYSNDKLFFTSGEKNFEGKFSYYVFKSCKNCEDEFRELICSFKSNKEPDLIPLKKNHYNWIISEDHKIKILSKHLKENLNASVNSDFFKKFLFDCKGKEGDHIPQSKLEMLPIKVENTRNNINKKSKRISLIQFAPFKPLKKNTNFNIEISCEKECEERKSDNYFDCPYKSDTSLFHIDKNNIEKTDSGYSLINEIINKNKDSFEKKYHNIGKLINYNHLDYDKKEYQFFDRVYKNENLKIIINEYHFYSKEMKEDHSIRKKNTFILQNIKIKFKFK